jgi:hypothetical protein
MRLGITISVIDPYIYILLRKENMKALQGQFKRLCVKRKFATNSGSQNITPSSESLEKIDVTVSSANTLSSDDLLILDGNKRADFEILNITRC